VDLHIHSPIRLHDIVLNRLSTGPVFGKKSSGVLIQVLTQYLLVETEENNDNPQSQ
jgi:hypothetical protein